MDEVLNLIAESKAYLEDYRMYGRMVLDAIEALGRLEVMIYNPSEENLKEARKITKEFSDQIAPYRAFVPTLAEKLDKIQGWLLERA